MEVMKKIVRHNFNKSIIKSNYSYTGILKCEGGDFFCPTGYEVCIGAHRVCDGREDCANAEDEQGCKHTPILYIYVTTYFIFVILQVLNPNLDVSTMALLYFVSG